MLEYIENIKQQPEGPNGRSSGKRLQKGGGCTTGILEWTTEPASAFRRHLEVVVERLPTPASAASSGGRAEEARTLRIAGLFRQGARTGIFYECGPTPPVDLREVLLTIRRPPEGVIRGLARVVATQVRSLAVHFQIDHTALRTESFVFLGAKGRVDYARPYVLDLARPSVPDMYRHPEYRSSGRRSGSSSGSSSSSSSSSTGSSSGSSGSASGESVWFYQVWALMMVLSEIAEWRPLDQVGTNEEEVELLRRKLDRKRLVTSAKWKSALPAQVFKYGFGVLEADRETLETYSRWQIKQFYDELCELLLSSPP
ncbi:hypothetical protein F4859DRAFT_223377 [Xylaria cf. heliscus]|nr:hypothetical protein F4859DRAFT_223377 [Xylaria cf. heliscus]